MAARISSRMVAYWALRSSSGTLSGVLISSVSCCGGDRPDSVPVGDIRPHDVLRQRTSCASLRVVPVCVARERTLEVNERKDAVSYRNRPLP